jgi:glycine cleavage system T protein (aminomethyltransferase)
MALLIQSDSTLRTPLYGLHCEMCARFVSFAGYEMPIQYKSGILKEHLHTREAAGIFDVSHMGQLAVRPRRGGLEIAQQALERVLPGDMLGLVLGLQRYSLLTNPHGGILDDIMVGHCGDHLLLVVNASRKANDLLYLIATLGDDCLLEPLNDRALIAVQGPASERLVAQVIPEAREMHFMSIREVNFAELRCTISRSGYTGEDGFEIGVPASAAEAITRKLLASPDAALIGLGARDTLRLEAGLCLYGADLDESTTPTQASLSWVIGKARRFGGQRAGGFPGAECILEELRNGSHRVRVGLKSVDRTIIRGGTSLFADAVGRDVVGTVTSGGFGPSVNASIAMAYVASSHAALNNTLFAEVRGRRIRVNISPLPFVPHRYKR